MVFFVEDSASSGLRQMFLFYLFLFVVCCLLFYAIFARNFLEHAVQGQVHLWKPLCSSCKKNMTDEGNRHDK